MTTLLEAALEYAAKGIPIFVCAPGSKKPREGSRGFHDATTDETTIRGWFADEPNLNVAFSPHHAGLCIVDLDGREAREAWEVLQIENGEVPATYTVQTPRGPDHLHLYFHGVLPTSVSILAQGIDTRGVGSYALLPPSQVGGHEYVIADDRSPAELPDWLLKLIDSKRERSKAAIDDLDLPANVGRAINLLDRYVASGNVAIEGRAGNKRTYSTAAEVMSLGLSPEKALELMAAIYNPACVPPWDDADLEQIVANAAEYAQNEAGAFGVGDTQETFGAAIASLSPEDKTGVNSVNSRPRFYAYSEAEQDTMPEPSWIIPGLLPDFSTVLMYGDRETYKSFLALDIALTLAAGRDYNALTHPDTSPLTPSPVIYVAGEGPRSISHLRRPAWRTARGVDGQVPFFLVPNMPSADMRSDDWADFAEAVSAIKPRLIVVDTLSRAMAGLNENDAKDASTFISKIEDWKTYFGCSVLVLHHAGKTGDGARGSSALEAGFDAVFRVEAEREVRAVKLTCTKMKDADHPPPRHYEMRQIGPSIVPFPIEPRAFKLLTPPDDKAAVKAVAGTLARLGAVSEETAVTTEVLATAILPESPDETPEERQDNISRVMRSLRSRARVGLAPFASGVGQDILWSLSGV